METQKCLTQMPASLESGVFFLKELISIVQNPVSGELWNTLNKL